MSWYFVVLIALVVAAAPENESSSHVLPFGALTAQERQHFLDVFSNFNKESVKEAHYAFIGASAIDKEAFNGVKCDVLKSHFDSNDAEMQYYALSAARGVALCTPRISKPEAFKKAFDTENLTANQLFYLVSSSNFANVTVNKATILNLLTKLAARETSAVGLSTVLATAALVSGATSQDLLPFVPLVAKIVEQADEVDGNTLFLERGAYQTAFAVESILNFVSAMKTTPAVTEQRQQQLIKVTNYLYERRQAHQVRTAARVASALKTLETNTIINPVVVYGDKANERAGVSGILVPVSRKLHLHFKGLLGTSLDARLTVQSGALMVESETGSLTSIGPSSLGQFKRLSGPGGAFELDLSKAGSLPRGRYYLEITATPSQSKGASPLLTGVTKAKIPLRVVSPLKLEKSHLKVTESSKTVVDSPVAYPGSAYANKIAMHHTSRLRLTFDLVDGVASGETKTPPPPQPQQVFVQFTHAQSEQTVTYLVKRSTIDSTYTFTLTLDSSAEDFGRLSGAYKMAVLVGDALVESPINWHVADVDLQFPAGSDLIGGDKDTVVAVDDDVARLTVSPVVAVKRSVHPLVGDVRSVAKPLLEHTFRKPEPRPSNTVAFAFTGLCCAPLGILLIAWPVMGANLRNMPCSLYTPLFHLGLGAIFGLYVVYWFHLDMFTTLRYLFFLGVFTFFTGNRLLRQLVARRLKSEE